MNHSLIRTISAGAILLLASGASAQNLFVSDYTTGDIYEYSSGGVQSIFATGLENPSGLAFDSAGDLFATDERRGNIYEFINNNGTLSSTATLYATGFSAPSAVAFDTAGNLYVANVGFDNIVEITTGQVRTTFVGNLSSPWGEAFDSAGNLFVSNEGNNTITKVTPTGTPSSFASGLSNPGLGVAFNNQGDLFVGNVNNYIAGGGSITEFTPAGTPSSFASGIGAPGAIAFNSAGDLLVAQGSTSHILEYASDGALLQTISISGAQNVNGLAFQDLALPVPEPSALALIALGGVAALIRRFRKNA